MQTGPVRGFRLERNESLRWCVVGGPVMEWDVKSPAPAGTEFACFACENGNEYHTNRAPWARARTEPCLCVVVVSGGVLLRRIQLCCCNRHQP